MSVAPASWVHSRTLALAVASIATGTSASGQTPPAPRIRDSAGVRIVEHAAIRNAPAAFTIADRPSLDLGGLRNNPDAEFNSGAPFLTAKRLSDGRVVTTDNSSLKIFDRDGKFVRNVGRKGSGPGEFNQVLDVCVAPGDTLIAVPYSAPRIVVFDSAGRHVRTLATAGYPGSDPCFADGSVLFRTHTEVNPATTMPRELAAAFDRRVTVTRYPPSAMPSAIVGQFPSGNESATFSTKGNIVVRHDSIYAGNGEAASVAVYSAAGTLARVIRWNDPRTPITDGVLDEKGLSSVPMNASASVIAALKRRARARPHQANVPAYWAIKVDAAGRIWIQDYPFRHTRPYGWTVFDGAGRLLGRVALPHIAAAESRTIELVDIGNDFVVLCWRDKADGAAHISFHALTRTT